MSNNAGYKGQTATSAGAFYTPYVPLQLSGTNVSWRAMLQHFADSYPYPSSMAVMTEYVWECMQERWPGAYQVVVDNIYEEGPVFRTRYGDTPKRKRVELRLQFDNPEEETIFLLKYE